MNSDDAMDLDDDDGSITSDMDEEAGTVHIVYAQFVQHTHTAVGIHM